MTHPNPTAAVFAPDLKEAQRFLALLDPSTETFTFQTFADRKSANTGALARVFHGTLAQHSEVLAQLNRQGAGVFVTVNKTDGKGRKASNITAVRAVWHEDDIGAPLAFHCRPSLIVESSPGKRHRYWFVDGLGADEHRGVEELMDVVYGSDPNAKDISRVLRLPGFLHSKGEPFVTRIVEASGRRYMRTEILAAFPPITPPSAKPQPQIADPVLIDIATSDPLNDAYAVKALKLECEALAGIGRGGRNDALNKSAVKLGGFIPHRLARSEVEAELFAACVDNGLVTEGEDAVWRTMRSGLEHGMKTPRLEHMPLATNGSPPEIDRLASLSALAYDKERVAAAEAMGVRVTVLDGEVFKKRKELEAQSSSAEFLSSPELWADPVDGAELLEALVQIISRHIVLPEFAAEAIALWIMHAHAFDAATISPILAFESPEKRCGKTTAMHIVGALVPKALSTSNTSAAGVFRSIEKYRPTFLIDEADTFLPDNDDLRGVLNAGQTRGSFTLRCVGDDNDVKPFSTWAPKAIALIGELPDTLQDRAIAIRLRRKSPDETVGKFRLDRVGDFTLLRSKAARWASDHMESLAARDPVDPSGLNDRACDNWRALLALADELGGMWPVRARDAAAALSGVDREAERDPTDGVQLLTDIRAIFSECGQDSLTPVSLVFSLCELPDGVWMDWRFGKSITDKWVAKLLKPFGIKSRRNKSQRYYSRVDFEDAWRRYLPL